MPPCMFCHVWESTLGLVPGNSRVDACHAFHRSAMLTLFDGLDVFVEELIVGDVRILLLLLLLLLCCAQ